MKRKKRIEITRESRRVLRVRLPETTASGWCEACAADVRWVTVPEAAVISGDAERAIQQRLDTSSLHFIERRSGPVLVCFQSLMRSL